jgi:hypothetical protein
MNENYIWFTTFGYIILILGTVGLIWGYLLSTSITRRIIISFKKHAGFRFKLFFWIMNLFFWITFLAMIMAYYFFTVWYVINPEAIEKKSLVPSYFYKKQ